MPTRAPAMCSTPNCPELAVDRKNCTLHKKDAARKEYAHRGTLTDRGYPANWAKVRAGVLRRDPVCKGCNEKLSTECDHLQPLERGGSNQDENLQGLCKPCHSRKTVVEQRVFDPATVMARVRDMAQADRRETPVQGYRGSNP